MKSRYTEVQVKILNSDILSEAKAVVKKELDERRSCENNRIDQYIKTICELQRATKSLKSQLDRLESQMTIK